MVNSKFWDDHYIRKLNKFEKLLFLYFITNPLTNICGVYEIDLDRVCFDTGIKKNEILNILQRFEKDNKAIYRDGWIWIKNFIKNQVINDSVRLGIIRAMGEIPLEIHTKLKTGWGQGGTGGVHPVGNLTKLNLTNISKADSPHHRIFEFFVLEVKKQYNITPAINGGKDGRMVQSSLKKYGEEKVKKIIEYYLQSDKAKRIGFDLSTALSSHSINMYLKDNEAVT